MNIEQPLKVSQFYAKDINKFEIISSEKATHKASCWKNESKRMPNRLMGPSQNWQRFRKQADALEVAKKCTTKTDTFCTFVFEKDDGFREFVVAHPEVYWWYTSSASAERRCSYEVIPEGSPCWLYFDLEFQKDLNPDSDGPKMTDTIIKIFRDYLLKWYELSCEEKDIVNLDSTRNTKFSRHLIFSIKDIAFRDNSHVGRLVKSVCREIEDYLDNSAVVHDILSKYERKDLERLFINTDKKRKIFIDTGVYTRNRHFRIYKSTKWGKLTNLIVAPESKHVPKRTNDERNDKDLSIFLDSLISYFPNKDHLIILDFDENDSSSKYQNNSKSPNQTVSCSGNSGKSRYPALDKFILTLVKPGKIRVCKEFDGRKIIYEIVGHRYCANIDRQHKSNNVYWIADLTNKTVYQKCHDEDCLDFASKPMAIPQEVSFQLADEFDQLLFNLLEPEAS